MKSNVISKSRNYFTGKSILTIDNTAYEQLLDGDYCYMNWEEKYLQRRFESDSYLFQLKEEIKNDKNNNKNNIKHEPSSPSTIEKMDKLLTEKQERFNKFVNKHNGDKALLILDVDNTMLYVRFFSDEMRIGDIVTYFDQESVIKNNAKVLRLKQTLSLEVTNSHLIDQLGSERTQKSFWITNNLDLQKYTKNGTFNYNLNNSQIIPCRIIKIEITACIIQVRDISIKDENEDSDDDELDYASFKQITIDFTSANDNLSKLEPCLNRKGMLPIDFIFEGFLIRLRPNLDEFLEYVNEDFDIVIYTAANKSVYAGLLNILHEYVKNQLGRENEEDLELWSDVLYRDDCTLNYDLNGKPYHHKDLTLFGCDLSRTIMVDNSPHVLCGEEPNVILIRDFFGRDELDDEFMEVYNILDVIINIEGDVRYFLCDIDDEEEDIDLSTKQSCLEITDKFINALKSHYKSTKRKRTSISFSISRSQTVYSQMQNTHNTNSNTDLHAIAESNENFNVDDYNVNPMDDKKEPPLPLQYGRSAPHLHENNEHRSMRKWKHKGKKRNKSVLQGLNTSNLTAKRRHTRFSSMSPIAEDLANFNVLSVNEDDSNDMAKNTTFNRLGSVEYVDFATDTEDESDYEHDHQQQEYDMLITSSPKRRKKKEIKFSNMATFDGMTLNEDDTISPQTSHYHSPSTSETRLSRHETKQIIITTYHSFDNDDEDEKTSQKELNDNDNTFDNFDDDDDEKINVNKAELVQVSSNSQSTESLSQNDNDDDIEEPKNDNKIQRTPRVSRDLNENNNNRDDVFCQSNFIFKIFCM